MASIEERVENLLEKTINDLGYTLYDVEYAKEAKNYFLRIFIDKADGIDLKDCEKVNNAITELLDEADYIKDMYFLEVSSPGIERIIRKEKHLKKYIGHEINIKLFKKDKNGNKEYQGILKAFDQENIELEADSRIDDEDLIHLGNLEFKVIHTPGHTKGGTCLYCKEENCLFSGDTLFRGTWGRTDLPTSDFDDIMNSIINKLLILPDDTIVYPGHGKSTMIENEKPIYLELKPRKI